MSAVDLPAAPPPAREALARLEGEIGRHSGLIVAFSGGVDSGVLLAAAVRVLGDRALALTADSPSMPRRELDDAIAFARSLGARHEVVTTGEMDREEYVRNERDRCFFCKQTLFTAAAAVAAREGIGAVAYGYTRDDAGDWRPGHQAAKEAGVVAPLHDAGLGKDAIRAIARDLGLELWDKPAAPCLSSRIPYGSSVTLEKLSVIESMEETLHELGFRICRARWDGVQMRLEFLPGDIVRASSSPAREAILARARELGVGLLTVDLEGFQSGKLNRSAGS